ncbi:MAG: alcohol dehydrogenase catalytic domain-containing protein [Gammaproteobacteria bacterium]
MGVGVCHTDLVCRDQYFPVPLPCIFGHEGSGIVETVGANVTKVAPGDHVVLNLCHLFNLCHIYRSDTAPVECAHIERNRCAIGSNRTKHCVQ